MEKKCYNSRKMEKKIVLVNNKRDVANNNDVS